MNRYILDDVRNAYPEKLFQVVMVSHLAGYDMDQVLFIETNPQNQPEIQKLIRVIDLLCGTSATKQSPELFPESHVTHFFQNPLTKFCCKHTTYILEGKMVLPIEIRDNMRGREVVRQWEDSPLQDFVFPTWENICEKVSQFC